MPKFDPNQPQTTNTPTVMVEGLPAGQHRFQLIVEDEVGNRSDPSIGVVTVMPTAPVITALNPGYGAWGAQVVIQGRNFDPNPAKNQVTFNGVAAQVEGGTVDQLIVRVPQPATTGRVSVLNIRGQAVSPKSFIIPRVSIFGLDAQPRDLDLDELKSELWIAGLAGQLAGVVVVFSLSSMSQVGRIRLEGIPDRLAVSPARDRRLCVAISKTANTATIIELGTRRVSATIQIALPPDGVAISPDGHWACVVSSGVGVTPTTRSGMATIIDLTTSKKAAEVKIAPGATEVVFGPNGLQVFINSTMQPKVTMFDAANHTVAPEVIKTGSDASFSPLSIAVSANTYPCWTANGESKTACIIDDTRPLESVPLPETATLVALNRKGARAYLANNTHPILVSVFADIDFMKQSTKMPAPVLGQKSLGLTTDDRSVFALHPQTNEVSFHDSGSLELEAIVPVPDQPIRGLATNDGKLICVICQQKEALTIIERASIRDFN